MERSIQTVAARAAHLLLETYRHAHPEWTDCRTPIDEIVLWLGLHIATFHPDDYPRGTYGFIDPDEEEGLIWLCRGLPESLHRFTLAHELGHAILHNKRESISIEPMQQLLSQLANTASHDEVTQPSQADPCLEMDVREDLTAYFDQHHLQETQGIAPTYDPRSQRELAANIFAAELLMPLDQVQTLYQVERVQPAKLANMFAVSQAAMLNRLAELLKDALNPPAPQPPHPPAEAIQPPPRKQFDEFQQQAIEAPTPALIVAGPGSGKTSTLIGRVEYIIRTLGVPPQRILALTFSRKAAQEMEERIQRQLGQTVSSQPMVSTFHSYCANLLRNHGPLVGLRPTFSLIDEAEGFFILRQQAKELRLHHYQKLQTPTYHFPDLLKAISRAKDELISPDKYMELAQAMKQQACDEKTLEEAEKAIEVAHAYACYEKVLSQRGDTDFGGLLVLTVQLFQQHPSILQEQQHSYHHILVDEFQDMNRASGVLLQALAGEQRNVWVVGDANQAIYGFRGASPANINQFEHDFPGATILPLSHNYRSQADLVTLAEAFRCAHLETGQEPGKNRPTRSSQPTPLVTLSKAADETCEFIGLIQDIQYKHAQGYAYRDMMILCRTRAQAQRISRALEAKGLPILEQGSVLEQAYIKDVLSILLLLTNTGGMGLLRAGRIHEHPLSQHDIEQFLIAAHEQKIQPQQLLFSHEIPLTVSTEGRHAFQCIAEILQVLQTQATNELPLSIWTLLARYLLIETSLLADLLATPETKQSKAMLANYDALLQLARRYDQQQVHVQQPKQEADPGVVTQPVSTQAEFIRGFFEYLRLLVQLRQDGASRQSAEEDQDRAIDLIRVMTVHASKGLEFPIVYMPGLVQRRFPLQARSSPITAPTGMLPPESIGSAAHQSGEACLFYVGITRARDQLILSYSERYGKIQYKRSPYIDALEAGLPEERLTKLLWTQGTALTPGKDTVEGSSSSQPSQEFLQIMKPTTLNASEIETYKRCPRQYAYSAIYHFTDEEDGYRVFWQALHKTVETLTKHMQEQTPSKPLTRQEIREIYLQHWQTLGGHTTPFATMYEQHGHEIIETLHRDLTTQEQIQWELHSNVPIEIAGKTVRVTIDRVETSLQAQTPAKFVRTRFGRRKTPANTAMRELFYTLAYRQQHPGQVAEVHSHNMSTNESIPVTLTTRKEQSLYEDAEHSIRGIENNEYPPLPAEAARCPSCPFFFICPA